MAGARRRRRSTAWSPTTRPRTADLKRLDTGDFGEAWGGIASLQLGLPLMWTAAPRARDRARAGRRVDVRAGRRPWPGSPARARSSRARDADLVAFAPDASFVVDPQRLHHRNPVTPYAGRRLSGVVRDVWLRGDRIVADGAVAPPPRGPPAQEGAPMTGFTHLPDLASRDLAGSVCAANDEFFAARENLIRPEPPVGRARVRPQGQGVRRLGDPPAPRARQRLGDRAARRAGRGPRRRRRHVVLHRQLPAARLGRGCGRRPGYPSAGGARRAARGSRWCRGRPARGDTVNEYAVSDRRASGRTCG